MRENSVDRSMRYANVQFCNFQLFSWRWLQTNLDLHIAVCSNFWGSTFCLRAKRKNVAKVSTPKVKVLPKFHQRMLPQFHLKKSELSMEIRVWNHLVSNPMSATCRRFVDVPAVTRREMPKFNKVLGDNLTQIEQTEVIFDSLGTCRSTLPVEGLVHDITGYERHQEHIGMYS